MYREAHIWDLSFCPNDVSMPSTQNAASKQNRMRQHQCAAKCCTGQQIGAFLSLTRITFTRITHFFGFNAVTFQLAVSLHLVQ